jgi:hypothetical protein
MKVTVSWLCVAFLFCAHVEKSTAQDTSVQFTIVGPKDANGNDTDIVGPERATDQEAYDDWLAMFNPCIENDLKKRFTSVVVIQINKKSRSSLSWYQYIGIFGTPIVGSYGTKYHYEGSIIVKCSGPIAPTPIP